MMPDENPCPKCEELRKKNNYKSHDCPDCGAKSRTFSYKKMAEKKVCACGNSIDYKPDDDYHLQEEGATGGMCKDCLEHEHDFKLKSNDRAFRTGWSVMKAGE